jgi:hypothetical protein
VLSRLFPGGMWKQSWNCPHIESRLPAFLSGRGTVTVATDLSISMAEQEAEL